MRSYTFTKNSPDSSYVLLAMSDVVETALQDTQMEAWRHYMEKHHKYWLKYIRKKWLDPDFKAEKLILLCGVIKTSSWVIATLPKEGTYRLDVQDTPVGIRPTLKLGGKNVSNGLRYGQDTLEGNREIIKHFAKLAGLQVPDSDEPVRKRYLFLRGLRAEKDFWLPKRIVAAAEPKEPWARDGDDFELPRLALTSSQQRDRGRENHRFPCRDGSETTLPAIRHFQVSTAAHSDSGLSNARSPQTPKTAPRASPPTPSLSLLTVSLDYNPCHIHCSSPPPAATSRPNMTAVVVF